MLAASVAGVIVLSDDFGDALDAATAEHLAAVVRARAGQVWLATRRPEAARAFDPGELVRLTRHGGNRAYHALVEPTDKKEIAVRRLLHTQLLPALTAPVIAIVEGPHDLTTYSSADRRRAAAAMPLSAAGVRLISADNGSGGGTGQIPRVADLARSLGFRVIALIDHDSAKASASALADIQPTCDVVVRLPPSTAVEQALVTGVEAATLRLAAAIMPTYGVPDPTWNMSDAKVAAAISQVLHKKGLHEQFLDALFEQLGALPPILDVALAGVISAASFDYAGPPLLDLPCPPAS